MTKTDKPVTVLAPGMALGIEGKGGENCRRSMQEKLGLTKPRQEPEVAVAKTVKAGKATKPAAKNSRKARVERATKDRAQRLILKQNVEVRNLLTKAAQAAGGTRLQPIGFESYTHFLAGVPLSATVLDADGKTVLSGGDAEVVFIPVKGNAPIQGKNVKLTIKGGKVVKVK